MKRPVAPQSPAYDDAKPASDFRSWRVQAAEGGRFDELVVRLGKNQSVHLEVMDAATMFVDIAGVRLWLLRVDGVWIVKGPEVGADALTRGFDSGARNDPERRRVVKLGKERLAALGKRQRVVARAGRVKG